MRVELLTSGDAAGIRALLEKDAVSNLALAQSLRRAGVDNVGLDEQGYYFGVRRLGSLVALLHHDNQGIWRFVADEGETLRELAGHALELNLFPSCVVGEPTWLMPLLDAMGGEMGYPSRIDAESVLLLEPAWFTPRPGAGARFAATRDMDALAGLERELQLELLRHAPPARVLRRYLAGLLENGPIAVSDGAAGIAAKADVEMAVPGLAAMGGVITSAAHRREGHAAAACSLLCSTLLGGGRVTLNAGASDEAALALYRSLGFRHHCDWGVAVFE